MPDKKGFDAPADPYTFEQLQALGLDGKGGPRRYGDLPKVLWAKQVTLPTPAFVTSAYVTAYGMPRVIIHSGLDRDVHYPDAHRLYPDNAAGYAAFVAKLKYFGITRDILEALLYFWGGDDV